MSSLWDVPAYLIMAFSLALDAPAEKASRDSMAQPAGSQIANSVETSEKLSEQAWLRAVKLASPRSDILTVYGSRIFATSSGRYYVPSARDRREIAGLQNDGEVKVRVLAAATLELKARLRRDTGLRPTRGALLVAYLYGRKAAARYLRALARGGEEPVSRALPGLAKTLARKKVTTVAGLEARLSRVFPANARLTAVAVSEPAKPDHEVIKGTLSETAEQSGAKVASASRIARQ